jgi:ABC-type Fe3+-hydroxamate transport system substrate-binding protein
VIAVAIELADVRGVPLVLDGPPRRVVSLVPSITETLFDLGVGARVAGITDWCIFPESLDLPRVGGTKNPRIEEIRALEPDLVHMNLEENLKRHADAIEEFAHVFVSEPKSPRDVVRLLGDLGWIHACQGVASERVGELEAELRRPPLNSFSFACPIWKSPWMWCGGDTYLSSLVESIGGRNVLGDRERYPSLELDWVVDLEPDVVLLPDEPFAFSPQDAMELASSVRGRIVGPFPGHLVTWHGTRTLLGLRALRELLT